MDIRIPRSSLVVLIGPSGSGKSVFAGRHFRSTEVVAADHCRALITDDETNQRVTEEAFAILHTIVAMRLKFGRLTVVDATNVQPKARRPLLGIATEHRAITTALVFNLPLQLCLQRNRSRPDRQVPEEAIVRQHQDLLCSLPLLTAEGFHHAFSFSSAAEIDDVRFRWLRPDNRGLPR
jgi:protein phosphatase